MSGTTDGSDDPVRVVVVDDEPDVRLLLRLQLDMQEGLTVVGEASDGREAVEVCRSAHPDTVVLDLLMPRMSGFEAIAALRREHPDIGVVAYTAVAGDYVREEMQRVGVELVLKSGDVGKLAAALRRSVQRPATD